MRRIILLAAALLLGTPAAFAAEQSIPTEHAGVLHVTVPEGWANEVSQKAMFKSTTLELSPPEKNFQMQIIVNDLEHLKMAALTDKDLEKFIEQSMKPSVPRSVEGKLSPARFGAKKDGVYARLTDKMPNPGEHLLLTQGVRLLPENKGVALFTLLSDDKDEAVLKQALTIIEGISLVPRAEPGK